MNGITQRQACDIINQYKNSIHVKWIELDPEKTWSKLVHVSVAVFASMAACGFYMLYCRIDLSNVTESGRIFCKYIAYPSFSFSMGVGLSFCLTVGIQKVQIVFEKAKKRFYADLATSFHYSDAPLEGRALQALFSYKVHDTVKINLINKMNFDQLGEVRRAVGVKRFYKLLDQAELQPHHQVWKRIDQLLKTTKAADLVVEIEHLKRPVENDPFFPTFITILDKELKVSQPKNYLIVRDTLWKLLPELETVKADIRNHPPIFVAKRVAETLSGIVGMAFGLPSLDQSPKKLNETIDLSEFIKNKTDESSFRRIFALLNREHYSADLNEWLTDLKNSDQFFDQETRTLIEGQFNRIDVPLTFNNYRTICTVYRERNIASPTYNRIKQTLEQLYQGKREKNLEKDLAFAREFGFDKILAEYAERFKAVWQMTPTVENLYNIYLVLSPADFDNWIATYLYIGSRNFRAIYDFFRALDSDSARKVTNICLLEASKWKEDQFIQLFGYQTEELANFRNDLIAFIKNTVKESQNVPAHI